MHICIFCKNKTHPFCGFSMCIIALKASGRDCTYNNELLHKIGVLQRYVMQFFVITSEFDGAVSTTVVLKETENKVEGSSPRLRVRAPVKPFCILFFAFAKMQEIFLIYMFAEEKGMF